MKARLFELADAYNRLFDLALDENVDLAAVEEGLQAVEGAMEEKVKNCIGLLRELEARRAAFRHEADRLTRQARFLDNRIKGIQGMCVQALDAAGKRKVITDYGTMRVQNNPPALSYDEGALGAEWFDEIPARRAVAKERLKAALKAGEQVPGAQLVQGRGLRIR